METTTEQFGYEQAKPTPIHPIFESIKHGVALRIGRIGPHLYLFILIIHTSYDNFLCIHVKIINVIAVKPMLLSNK